MPSRYIPRDLDPAYQDVYSWDDGFKPDLGMPQAPEPPPAAPSKTAKYIPKGPPSDDFAVKPPRLHDPEPFPPRHRRRLSPSPIRDGPPPPRGHHHRDLPPPPRDHHHDTHRDRHRDDHHRHRDDRRPPPARHSRPPLGPGAKTSPVSVHEDLPPRRRPQSSSPRRHRSKDRSHHQRAPRSEGSKRSSHDSPSQKEPPSNKRPGIQRSKTTDMNAILSHPRFQKAAAAALSAGATSAFNLRRAPGSWYGEKGTKVATAALGAAAMDALAKKAAAGGDGAKPAPTPAPAPAPAPKEPDGVHVVGSALGGYLANQFANRKKSTRR